MPRKYPDIKIRLKANVAVSEAGCWNRTTSSDKGGYTKIWHLGASRWAHRVSWTVFRGEIPSGIDVLHRCDNPKCINPDHLFLGTHTDNMRDMLAKNRRKMPAGKDHMLAKRPELIRRGEAHCRSKLTDELVLRIRADPRGSTTIARELRLHRTTVIKIRSRQAWTHI